MPSPCMDKGKRPMEEISVPIPDVTSDPSQKTLCDSRDERQSLLKEVKIALEQVKESEFYSKLKKQIASGEFQEQLKSVLGSRSKLKMVIYALGSLEFDFNPHDQLAIALLLEQDFSWIKGIEVYDPVFSSADEFVLENLGCEILKNDERGMRKVEIPTLFYMPFTDHWLLENLLKANWCPSRINKLIILTNKFKDKPANGIYKKGIYEYTKAICAENYEKDNDNIFYEFAWHFFHVDSELNMKKLLPGKIPEISGYHGHSASQMKRAAETIFEDLLAEVAGSEPMPPLNENAVHRHPQKYRCHSSPPPEGLIKLYVSGIGAEGDANQAGFGGICYNELKESILDYKGCLNGKVDGSAACLEALKRGLRSLVSEDEPRKLIVVGDDLKVIHWASNRHKPPEEVRESWVEVLNLLKKFRCVIYHIYEEANLAKERAMSAMS